MVDETRLSRRMDGSILMNRAVLESGAVHEKTPSAIRWSDCRSCKRRLRADQIINKKGEKQCRFVAARDLTESRAFNLMSKPTSRTEDESSLLISVLKPRRRSSFIQECSRCVAEKNCHSACADGKAFRNEINPRILHFVPASSSKWSWNIFAGGGGIKLLEYWRKSGLKVL